MNGLDIISCEYCTTPTHITRINLPFIENYERCYLCDNCMDRYFIRKTSELSMNDHLNNPLVFYARHPSDRTHVYAGAEIYELEQVVGVEDLSEYETTYVNTLEETLSERTFWFNAGDSEYMLDAALDAFLEFIIEEEEFEEYGYLVPKDVATFKAKMLAQIDGQIEELESKKRKLE